MSRTINLKNSSYLKIIHNGFKLSSTDYERLWKKKPSDREQYHIYGKRVDVPRYLKLYGDVVVRVSGQDFKGSPINPRVGISDILTRVLKYANNLTAKTYNACLVNWYTCGKDYIGFHSDLEKGIDHNVPIVSISLGGERRFLLMEKQTKKRILDITLENGMVLIMYGKNFQSDYKHSVPKESSPTCEPRINITVRKYSRHP